MTDDLGAGDRGRAGRDPADVDRGRRRSDASRGQCRRRLAARPRRPARQPARAERPDGARGRGRRHARSSSASRSPSPRSPPRHRSPTPARAAAAAAAPGSHAGRRPRRPRMAQRAVASRDRRAADRHLVRVAGARLGAVRRGRPRGRGRPGRRADRGDEAVQRDQVGPRGRVVRVVPESGALVKAKQPLIEVEPL